MRLAKIKLVGFKSFVDPTTLHLPSNLIGVVGTNGCGKSNVIDAVRWVMGETSAKHLRGDSMTDVIFNGSTARKPVGQASIELVFDNSSGKIGGQYAQYAEISVKRMVGRDGQSNYFLNGVKCRRKDITDIFLGTGLGPRSYSIIEQGMISRLIEAKPEDLRLFIEEAAGISKYKERRRETETRIRHTRDNLARLTDLRDELEKRIETLQRQAKAAEKYKELKVEERQLKAQLHALRWQGLNDEAEQKEKAFRAKEIALEAEVAELRRIEAQTESLRDAHTEANEHFNTVQGEFYAVGAEMARVEQAIQHAKETRIQQEKELSETEQAWQASRAHIESDRGLIETLSKGVDEDTVLLSEAQAKEHVSSERLARCEQDMQGWQQRWDTFNHRASEQLRLAEVERARIEHLEQHMMQLQDREKRLREEAGKSNVSMLEAEAEQYAEQLDDAANALAELDTQATAKQRATNDAKQVSADLRRQIKAKSDELQSLREQIASLDALQKEALGQSDDQANQWLGQHQLAGAKRLAQQLTVQSGWETAAEVVLAHLLDALCVEDITQLETALGAAPACGVAFLERGTTGGSAASGTLAQVVVADGWLNGNLEQVLIAETLSEALSRRDALEPNQSIVTRDGIWLGRHWLRLAHTAGGEHSVLAREQMLKSLRSSADQAGAMLAEWEERLAESEQRAAELDNEREQLLGRRPQIAAQHGTLQAKSSALTTRLEALRQRMGAIATELEEATKQFASDQSELTNARGRLNDALLANEGHDKERESLLQNRDTLRLELEDARKQSRTDRDTAHQIELRLQRNQAQLRATQESLVRTEHQLEHLGKRRDELFAALEGAEGPLADMARQLEGLLASRQAVESKLAQARRQVEEIDHKIRELNQLRQEVEVRIQSARDAIQQLRMDWQEVNVRAQTVLEQINEAQFELKPLLESLPPEATVAVWQEEVDKVGRSIQRLGAINLAAIDEYTEQAERKKYLDAQHEDLTNALTTLENAMHKIDRETRSRFKETYDKVNEGLQAKFPRLFGGGHAYLELTGEDLLETGITVMARPPGKRNSTIHLLSGGEKALTAVALVFSIFDLNPAPFCMLDEVDAPLDDANVGRFCTLVKEMSERVQFIFITHNKVTMEMANQLTGVTMHEPGVSRLVAVDLDEAVQMAVNA